MDVILVLNFNKIFRVLGTVLIMLTLFFRTEMISNAQITKTPLEMIKEKEIQNRDTKGEVFLGCVLTIHYPVNGIEPAKRYFPLLLELADVLNTPIRKGYRIELKGYTDSSGSKEKNLELSRKRVEKLKKLLVDKFSIAPDRIKGQALGDMNPVASNETPEGRAINRRVEIEVYGDVREAVRYLN